jgi:hypothetical protein
MRLFSEGLGLVTGLLLCAACTSADIGPDGSGAMTGQDAKSGASPHKGVDSGTVLESYGRLPMAFEKNQGQAGHPVDFISRGAGYRVLLTRSEAVVNLAAHPAKPSSAAGTLRMSFVGARRDSAAAGLDPLPGKTSYFKGADPSKHLSGIESFRQGSLCRDLSRHRPRLLRTSATTGIRPGGRAGRRSRTNPDRFRRSGAYRSR